MFTAIQCEILKRISPAGRDCMVGAYTHESKLALLGDEVPGKIADKTVIDFGCGEGSESVEMAQMGARRVIGVDIREEVLETARRRARDSGVEDRCYFTTTPNERADVIVSLDSFEHFGDPAGTLRTMNSLLEPNGEVIASFGPTWYHPLGGHLFSVFPWAHLIFSEAALLRWRSSFKADGATRFSEVAGGLNQMTIGRFEKLIAASPFKLADFELVPIRLFRHFNNRLTREFTTAIVRCRMVCRAAFSAPLDQFRPSAKKSKAAGA